MDMEIITEKDKGRVIYEFLDEMHDSLDINEEFFCSTKDSTQELILEYIEDIPERYLIVFAFFDKFVTLERPNEDSMEYRRIDQDGLMNILSTPFYNIIVERMEGF